MSIFNKFKKWFCLFLMIILTFQCFGKNNNYLESLSNAFKHKENTLYCISNTKINLSNELYNINYKIKSDNPNNYIICGYGQSTDINMAVGEAINQCWLTFFIAQHAIIDKSFIFEPLSISKYIFNDPEEPPVYMVIMALKILR